MNVWNDTLNPHQHNNIFLSELDLAAPILILWYYCSRVDLEHLRFE